jgi:group I intron endonuclease
MRRRKISGIYCIRNIKDEKRYIGYSFDISKRFVHHTSALRRGNHDNPYFQSIWNTSKEEDFVFEIIEEYPPDKKLLKAMEIYFIAYYNSFKDDGGGYNLTRGGEGSIGFKQSSESIESIKKNLPDRHGKNNNRWGKHWSDEWKKEQGKRSSARKRTEEEKLKTSNSLIGEKCYIYGEKRKGASSHYFGVSFHKDSGRWIMNINGKHHGLFKTELEAARFYDKYVVEHNINRPLNFPEEYPDYPIFIKKSRKRAK